MCAFDIPAQVRRRKADAEKTSLYNGVSSRASGFKVHVTIDGTSYQVSDESEVEAAKIYDRIVHRQQQAAQLRVAAQAHVHLSRVGGWPTLV